MSNNYDFIESFSDKILIGKIISNSLDYDTEDYTEEVKNRVNELGLTNLVAKDGYSINKVYGYQYGNELAKNLSDKSSKIQWKLGKFTKNDVKNAAEYLEVFILFAAQTAFLEHQGMKTVHEEEKLQKKVFNVMKILEDLSSASKKDKKVLKGILNSSLEALNSDINKILAKNVSFAHNQLFLKDVKRALKIFKNYK